ncbi:amino acid adenylation domain-containing protein [Actinoplanes sp. NPDC049118]|uniref:amino acid adenylation domain-containing protein n=1 Tax=Actinoplanes sp. NPDC049118 TaxID=3155769 RepID=UPI0033D2C3CC
MPDTAAWERHLQDVPRLVGLPVDRCEAGPDDGPAGCVIPGGPYCAAELAAGLAALLHRYSGESPLLVGLADGEPPGRLTVLRVTVDGSRPFAELRDAVPHLTDAARQLGAVTPPELLELRGLGTGPQRPCHAVVVTGDRCGIGAAGAELTAVADRGGRSVLVADATIPDTDAERIAGHLARLLAAGAAPAGPPLARLSLLDGEEEGRILHGWNDTSRPVPDEQFPAAIARIAAEAPDRVAVVAGARSLTYRQFDQDANRLAQHLAGLGVGRGDRVGVFFERSPESLLSQLAVFRLAATAVLLDPEYPGERLEFMVEDSAAAAVLTREGLSGRLGAPRCPVVPVDGDAWRAAPAVDPGAEVRDEEVCHIAYTSGSTGKPKAVQLRHGPLRNTAYVLREQCGLTAGVRGTWLCSPGFGLVQVDCFPILLAGGTVHIPEPAVAAAPEQLRDWLVEQRISQSLVLTAMAERLWTLPWPEGTELRCMRIAGERVRTWPGRELPFHVLNVYGSAEATVVATCDLTELGAAGGAGGRMPPIGRPVANVRTYVLDANHQPVPPGVLGELYISGASLSRGYLNRPDANDAKFLANDVPGDPYPVLYRSGDVARYWSDGTVEIIGRTDNEVKIRGYRVHLGEVEGALAEQPGVRQCVVLAREDVPGERRLVAYVEPDRAAPPRVAAVQAALRERLPGYMVPSAFVVGDLPTTPNGKIDRAALPPPPRTRPDLFTEYRAPATDAERAVARIWADTLELDEVGVDDDFFELGGDSLRVMRMLAGLRAELGISLRMSQLVRTPTVAALVELLSSGAPARRPELRHDPETRYEPFGVTAGPGVRYVEWHQEWLDPDRLVEAWRRLVAQQDALRLTFDADGGQRVVPAADAPPGEPSVLDLSLDDEAVGPRLDGVRAELLATRFDGAGPPYRLRLTLLPDEVLAVHLAVDARAGDDRGLDEVLPRLLAGLYEDLDRPAPELTVRDVLTAAGRVPGPAPVAGDPPPPAGHHRRLDARVWPALLRAAEAAGVDPRWPATVIAADAYSAAAGESGVWVLVPVAEAPDAAHDVLGALSEDRPAGIPEPGGATVAARAAELRDAAVRGGEDRDGGPVLAVRVVTEHDPGQEGWDAPVFRANALPGVVADLTLRPSGDSLHLTWTYRSDVLSRDLLVRIDTAVSAGLAAFADAGEPAPVPDPAGV